MSSICSVDRPGAVGTTGFSSRRFVDAVQRGVLLCVACVVVWALTGGAFWPAWVMLAVGLSVLRRAHRTFVAPLAED